MPAFTREWRGGGAVHGQQGKTPNVPRSQGSGEEGGAGSVEGVGAVPFDPLAWVGRMGGGGAAESFTGGNGGRETLGSGKEIEGCLGELAQGAGRARRTGLEQPDTRGAVAQRHDPDEWAGPLHSATFYFSTDSNLN
jgi:hypothetical protein